MVFGIGDKVRLRDGESVYDFRGTAGIISEGGIVEISAVDEERERYSVKGAYIQTPNWSRMDAAFELVERGLKVGDIVKIDCSRYNENNNTEIENGLAGDMRDYDGKIAKIESCEGLRYKIDIDGGRFRWHQNWLIKQIKKVIEVAVELDKIKAIQKLIKETKYQQKMKSDFDGRTYKDVRVIYAQMVEDKDRLDKERVVLRGMLFTEKLDDINRDKDFFVYSGISLTLFGQKRLAVFKDIPILNMARPDVRKGEKPKSLYNIKSKDLDSDLLVAIKKLIEVVKDCDIDTDIYFMLDSIRSKSELKSTINDILRMSHRKYDADAGHIFHSLNILVESL